MNRSGKLAGVILAALWMLSAHAAEPPRKVGVLYVVHGGSEENDIGGVDPAADITDRQFEAMTRRLEAGGKPRGIEFLTDVVHWLGSQTYIHRLPWPRYLYGPQTAKGSPLTYCGSAKDGGPWPHCNPQRYNVDGPGERLLKRGAEELIMVDLTTSGVRFWKTYDVVSMTRRMVEDWNRRNGTKVQVRWVNDPTDLMRASYPVDPPNWTRSLGEPKADVPVPLQGRPNPLIQDPLLIDTMVDGIIARFNPAVAPSDTAVLIVNHSIRDGNQAFDPKVNDTILMDGLIKAELLRRYPDMRADNILGSWMGRRVENPAITLMRPGGGKLERSREMRGESLGDAWLYETDTREVPAGSPLAASHKPEQNCANCLHVRGTAGELLRPCPTFPGRLVNAGGWCSVWAPG